MLASPHSPPVIGDDAPPDEDDMRLQELLLAAGLPATVDSSLSVGAIRHDSRQVRPGDLFVAVTGAVDGADFAAAARDAGAVAVVAASDDRQLGIPWIRVDDDRRALAELAAARLGWPSRKLAVVGVTGTNGKTTTAQVLAHVLREAGRCTGVVGTVGCRFADQSRPSARTTPEAPELQGLLEEMVEAGCHGAVIEVSSHGLELQRAVGTRFAAVAFTNLSQDHLDWHGDMESYYQAKRRLFSELAPDAPVVTCVDDESGRRLAAELAAPGRELLRVGYNDEADLTVASFEPTEDGGRLRLAGEAATGFPEEFPVTVRCRHDVQNLMVAAGLARLLGLDGATIARTLATFEGVRGRMERVHGAGRDSLQVYVDYAHTPGALRSSLQGARSLTDGKLHCVFGCGGDRDTEKREPMGRTVARLADRCIATSDNPRSEDPLVILGSVEEGLRNGGATDVVVEPDRRKAIELALRGAAPGDLVLVAGKGHETQQDLGHGRVIEFDDAAVVSELWAELFSGDEPSGDDGPSREEIDRS
ncbi:MAG: UDP-N-acetylmuramoyl-L-alanyl-D-glutamate--2,6-diaminopimelate ligase [Acidobacteriota bacterium]